MYNYYDILYQGLSLMYGQLSAQEYNSLHTIDAYSMHLASLSCIPKIFLTQVSITWKQRAELPTVLVNGKAMVVNGKVYCGGGWTGSRDTLCVVYCYDPSQDKWITLPPLPVRQFGLGQVNGKLVAVGGVNSERELTNEVYTYDERSRKWKQTIPRMPTARYFPGVLSLQSALVVAGGEMSDPDAYNYSLTAAVEIFKPGESQWYRTDPLPKRCYDISVVAIGNTCYALGGVDYPFHLNQALYASVDDLLGNAVPANRTTCSDTQSAWKTLPNTPTYGPAATVLAGNLLAIGGKETSDWRSTPCSKKEVYMYTPSTKSWIYISDLPAPRSRTAAAVLSPVEILVIGGHDGANRVKNVYKGMLCLK